MEFHVFCKPGAHFHGFRGVLAALGVGLFPIAFLCRFGGPWGSISEPFLTKLRVFFSRVFVASFFEALGGPKKGTSVSELSPVRGNWGGLGPPS